MKPSLLLLTLSFSSLLLTTVPGCSGPARRAAVVSNAATPVQVLQVRVGRHIDVQLPMPARSRWWTVVSGARPWLTAKTEKGRGRVRLFAVKPGKTNVVIALRSPTRVIRTLVVTVEVMKAGS